MKINFKLWLEGIEDYKPFEKLVTQKAQERFFAFNKWFPEERIYLPFSMNQNEDEDLIKDINDAIRDDGYEVSDLTNGYATRKNSKNIFKIGKLIKSLYEKDEKDLKQQLDSGNISKSKYENEKRLNDNYWHDLEVRFNQRGTSGNFLVVISKNIHDIASMSTGRGWESCMTLGTGAHHEDVYCEVQRGGFIAYLIRADDKDIRRPIARIHIRRFDNKQGASVAVPEETIYGEDVPQFMDVVKNWLRSKQGELKPGFYKRVGGKYSDTFGNQRTKFIPPSTTDVKTIESWLKKWIKLDSDDQKKFYPYFLNTMQSYFQSNEKFSDALNLKLKKYLFASSTFQVSEYSTQTTDQFLPAFCLKNPELIKKEDFEKAFKYAAKKQEVMVEKLIEKFPQFMTKELFDEIESERMKTDISQKDPELDAYHKQRIEDEAPEIFDINNPYFKVTDRNSIWQISGRISDELRKFHNLKPIPENIIRLLVNFANNLDKLQLVPETKATNPVVSQANEADAKTKKDDIIGDIIHAFSMTGSDTPTVQRFYQSLLPKYEQLGGIGVLGNAILSLKENGKQFLPFLIQKREELEVKGNEKVRKSLDERQYDDALEMYNYVIDSLQSSDFRSKKYRFISGKGIEYRWAQEENQKKKNELRDAIINKKRN